MIKMLLIESDPKVALGIQFESTGFRKNSPIYINYGKPANFNQIPDGYDIYLIHSTLVRPLEEFVRLRKDNPLAQIACRNSILDTSAFPPELKSAANVWDEGAYEVGTLAYVVDDMLRSWEI